MYFTLEKRNTGIWFILLLLLIPLVIWLFMKPFGIRFASFEEALRSFGQIAGLLGVVGFATTLFLSARFKFIEEYFGGYDRVYTVHHTLGVNSFLLLLVHPVFIAFQYAQFSVISAAKLFIPGQNSAAITYGIIALFFMMIVLLITLFARRLPYSILKSTHQLFGFIFFFGSLHVFFIPSDVSQSLALRYYILTLSVLALFAYAYRTLLGRWMVKRYRYEIEQVNIPTPGVTEVVMRPLGEPMEHLAGQFMLISFRDPVVSSEVHPFSISSAPHEDYLRVTVKALGDFTATLPKLSVGSIAYIEGPFGHFTYHRKKNKKQIWIAGGVGVTPFLSMARDLLYRNPEGYTIDFYYTTKNPGEAVFLDELNTLQARYPSIRFIPFYSDEKGFLSAQAVADMSGGVFGKDIFLCGPPPMMKGLTSQFIAGGITPQVIHSEAFKML